MKTEFRSIRVKRKKVALRVLADDTPPHQHAMAVAVIPLPIAIEGKTLFENGSYKLRIGSSPPLSQPLVRAADRFDQVTQEFRCPRSIYHSVIA